jgi:hypothetical protein
MTHRVFALLFELHKYRKNNQQKHRTHKLTMTKTLPSAAEESADIRNHARKTNEISSNIPVFATRVD